MVNSTDANGIAVESMLMAALMNEYRMNAELIKNNV